jgi:hypothetical protein
MMPSAANASQPLSPAGTLTGLGAGVGRSPQQKIGPIGNGPAVGVFVIAVGALGLNVGAGESTESGGTNTGTFSVLGS